MPYLTGFLSAACFVFFSVGAERAEAAESHPGQVVRTVACPSPCPSGLAVQGDLFWVVDRFTDKIYALDRQTGEVRRKSTRRAISPGVSR